MPIKGAQVHAAELTAAGHENVSQGKPATIAAPTVG
jgi:hypothetical protein